MKKFLSIVTIFLMATYSFIHFPVKAEEKQVFINEFLPDATGSDSGKEWIELYNNSSVDVSLKEWKIQTKTTTTPRSITLSDVAIKAKSFFIIAEFGEIINIDYLNVGAGKLNMYNASAEIYILDSNGNKIDDLFYGATQEGKSLERRGPVDSEFCNSLQLSSTSLGVENINKDTICWPESSVPEDQIPPEELPQDANPETSPESDDTPDEPEVIIPEPEEPIEDPVIPEVNLGAQSSILISEVYPSPNKTLLENEWLELYNQDILKVELSGIYLKERVGDTMGTTKSYLPNTTLEPGEYLIINESELKISLNNSGDEIYLVDENDTIVDNFKFGSIQSSNSASRKFISNSYLKVYDTNLVPVSPTPTPGSINKFPEALDVDIFSAKSKVENTFVKLIGVINSKLSLIDKNSFYLQDGISGIRVHLADTDTFTFIDGTKVEVIGLIKKDSDGQMYVEVKDLSAIRAIGNFKLSEININNAPDLTKYLGMIINFEGEIYKNFSTTFYLNSGTNVIKVRVISNSGVTIPSKSIGDRVNVVGVLINDDGIFTIVPRYSSDLKIFSEVEVNEKKVSTKKPTSSTPSTPSILGEDEELENSISNSEFYKNAGDKLYSEDSTLAKESKVYPWPVYLTSGSIALLEIVKTITKFLNLRSMV